MEEVTILVILFIALLIFLVITVICLILYSGVFESIDVGAGKPIVGEVVIAYKYSTGPYSKTGNLFTEITGIDCDRKAIGIYYDDPKKVEPANLRYIVGAILSEGRDPPDKNIAKKYTDEGFKIFTLPEVTNAVKTKFPHKSSFSVFIAATRVYPRMGRYIEDHRLCAHPMVEIYDGEFIHYMAPLARQNEFYVDETRISPNSDDTFLSEESLPDDSCSQSDVSMSIHTQDDSDLETEQGSVTTRDDTPSVSLTAKEDTPSVLSDDVSVLSDKSVQEESGSQHVASSESPGNVAAVSQSPDNVAAVSQSQGNVTATSQSPGNVTATNSFHDSGLGSDSVMSVEANEVNKLETNESSSEGNESGSSFEEIQVESCTSSS